MAHRLSLLEDEAKMNELKHLATGGIELRESSAQIGNVVELEEGDWFGVTSAHYHNALVSGAKAFPFMAMEHPN